MKEDAMNCWLSSAVTTGILFGIFCQVGCSPPPAETEPAQSAPSGAVVRAGGEVLRGEVLNEETGLSVFRGIPYAAPPVGQRRWRPPAAHSPREGEQDATSFGNVCPQSQSNAEWYQEVADKFGVVPESRFRTENIDEDCLYLNVWTSVAGTDEKLPVMVWIHGGGNRDGYAHEPDYHGHAFAERGVVYVSLNYRLAMLGFMAHPGLSAESEFGVSGNYGILDQIAALRWVEDNIAAFGGDPDNVTIFGESAGGANTGTLIASPLATGLFNRAIIQSGAYGVDIFYTLAEAETHGSAVASALELNGDTNDAETVARLRALDWRTFVDNPKLADTTRARALNTDGYVIRASKAEIFASGAYNHVNVLMGTNENERFMWIPADATAGSFREHLAFYGESFATELSELLAADIEADLHMAMDRFLSAETFLCGSRYVADKMSGHGDNVYFYYFTRARPGGEKVLAYHGAEIPYAHDTTADWLPSDETDINLTAAMSQYWLNFAKTGNPNGAGLPEWPLYDAESRRYQELGDVIEPGENVEPGICDILDRHRDEQVTSLQKMSKVASANDQ